MKLRYPEYEVNRMMPGSTQEDKNISEIMFNDNKYIDDYFEQEDDVRFLDWSEFYNTHAFISSLSWEEKCYLNRPKYYDNILYIDKDIKGFYLRPHLHISENGHVMEAENVSVWSSNVVLDEELEGLYLLDVLNLFSDRNIELLARNEIIPAIQYYNNLVRRKEELLNCVMYRIIERGGCRIGPRRGYLFAKEFNRDLSIPIKYGIDTSDPGLRDFLNRYLKDGGNLDLECYLNYDREIINNKDVETTTVKDLLKREISLYPKDEHELHQRLVNILYSRVDTDVVKKEEVKQLRLQRRSNKIN